MFKPALYIGAFMCASAAFADSCPEALDVPSVAGAKMEALRSAPNQMVANQLTFEMFRDYWTVAPDAKAQAMLDQGMTLRRYADYGRAGAILDELIAYCPNYAEGYNQRAFVAFLEGDYQKSVDLLDITLGINPEHVAAMSGLALSLLYMGRIETGQAVLKRALEFNPYLPERGYLIEPAGEDI